MINDEFTYKEDQKIFYDCILMTLLWSSVFSILIYNTYEGFTTQGLLFSILSKLLTTSGELPTWFDQLKVP